MELNTQLISLSGDTALQEQKVLDILQAAYQKNIQLANMQMDALLSSTAALLQTSQSQLSSIPTHSYEYWKYKYLDPNQRPKTIFELEFPQNFSPTVATQQISALSLKYNDIAMTQLQVLTSTESTVEPTLNIFATLSGNKFIVDEQKMKSHIEFHETLRAIPMDEIKNNPVITAYKIINEFLRVYS